jgi:3-oxoacyl-(acyl-carrier-protein) synthase
MTRRRVAITGLGVKSPAGCDLETFWSTLQAGRPCAAPIGSSCSKMAGWTMPGRWTSC